jgi:hypothetical protein
MTTWARVYCVTPEGDTYDYEIQDPVDTENVEVTIPDGLDRKAAIQQLEGILDSLRGKDAFLSKPWRPSR